MEWLGGIPSSWTPKRLKHVSPFITVGIVVNPSTYVSDEGLPFIYGGDIRDGVIDFKNSRRISPESSDANAKTKLKAGDVLTVRVGAPGVTAVVPLECEGGNCASVMLVRKGEFDSQWLCYAMNTRVIRSQVEVVQYGAAQKQFNIEHAINFWLPIPPLPEQHAIADFLDRQTAKIDALVAEQRKLIELLQEKRQAVISHAVTKGLNPDAPMKDSGIEWLGMMPAHWEVKALRTVSNVVRGASPRPAGDPRYFAGDAVPWVTVAEITKDSCLELTTTEAYLTKEGAGLSKLFYRGTVIYSNSGATLGVPKILAIDACANDGVVAFEQLTSNVLPEFLYHYLASITKSIREKVRQGSGQPNLNTDIVKALRIPVPPREEQAGILRHISSITSRFDDLVLAIDRGLDLLQERRTALISAAVTGKIDVRNIADSEAAA